MTTTSSQGATIGYGQETTFGSGAAAYTHIRPDEMPDWSTAGTKLLANPNVGHAHPANRSDNPKVIAAPVDGSLNLRLRTAAADGARAPLADFFESSGCAVKTTTATTVAVYTSTTAWTITGNGDQFGTVGDIILPKLEANGNDLDEYYYPVLVAKKNDSTEAITPAMALPAATANSEPIEHFTTIYPKSQNTIPGDTVAFEIHTRGDSSNDDTEKFSLVYTGGALVSCGEIVLKPQEPIIFPLNFSFADHARQSDQLEAETFVDTEKFTIVDNAFRIEHAVADHDGAIARADVILKEARIDLGITAVPVVGYGAGTASGRQGYILNFGQAKVKIIGTYQGEDVHPQYWTQLETPGTWNYLGLVQPTNDLTVPAFAFYMPKCRINPDELPKLVRNKDGGTVDCEISLIADSANFVSAQADGIWTDPGFAPWYMGMGTGYVAP